LRKAQQWSSHFRIATLSVWSRGGGGSWRSGMRTGGGVE
jgi:hypothetical protein